MEYEPIQEFQPPKPKMNIWYYIAAIVLVIIIITIGSCSIRKTDDIVLENAGLASDALLEKSLIEQEDITFEKSEYVITKDDLIPFGIFNDGDTANFEVDLSCCSWIQTIEDKTISENTISINALKVTPEQKGEFEVDITITRDGKKFAKKSISLIVK